MISAKLHSKILRLATASLDLPNCNKKHFSFIVNKNRIISFGYNQSYTTHPLSAKYGHRFNDIHSELAAIINFPYAPRFLQDYVLINVRLRKDSSIALSRPCIYCIKLLTDFKMYEVYYTSNDGSLNKL